MARMGMGKGECPNHKEEKSTPSSAVAAQQRYQSVSHRLPFWQDDHTLGKKAPSSPDTTFLRSTLQHHQRRDIGACALRSLLMPACGTGVRSRGSRRCGCRVQGVGPNRERGNVDRSRPHPVNRRRSPHHAPLNSGRRDWVYAPSNY